MINFFFCFLAIAYYLLRPVEYSNVFIQLVSLTFLTQVIWFIIKKSNGYYLNFYFLFFLSFYFINFFYPSVLFPIDPSYFSVFTLSTFDISLINKATSLAFVSSSFLILGSQTRASLLKQQDIHADFVFNHFNLTMLSLGATLLFIATVGKSFLMGDFTAHSGLSLYILQIALYTLTIASIIFIRNYDKQNKKVFFYFTALLFMSIFLIVGDRGPALTVLLAIASAYTYHVRKLSFPTLVIPIVIGILFMHLIGVGRLVSLEERDGGALLTGLRNFNFDLESLYQTTESFVVNAFTLYAGIDYADRYGLNYGSANLLYVASLFPFLQSLITSALGVEMVSSDTILTIEYLGENPSFGLGTNLVSDVYMSFGLIGCITFFYIIGLFVEQVRLAFMKRNTIPSNIVYFTLVAMAIYWPRASYLTPLKAIIWSLAIYYLFRGLSLLKPMRQ